MRRGWITVILIGTMAILAAAYFGLQALVERDQEGTIVSVAEEVQQEYHAKYLAWLESADAVTLTVTEQGETVGVFSLQQLGLREQLLADVEPLLNEATKLTPAEFDAWSTGKKVKWLQSSQQEEISAVLNPAGLDDTAVWEALSAKDRSSSENAYVYYENGVYVTVKETSGTELKRDAVTAAIRACLTEQVITETASPALQLEIADHDVYLPPEILAAEGEFDYEALLAEDAAGVVLTVEFPDAAETLEAASVLSVDGSGAVLVDTEALELLSAQWADTYRKWATPYILDGYVSGPVELEFLSCGYQVDRAALVDLLAAALLQLESTTVQAPFQFIRNGEPFAIEGTYVEVDIANQTMVYFVDGEVHTRTEVVTGLPVGHWTPPGYYKVQNRLEDQWLEGPDYRQFVEYWVGYDNEYGIHDAQWRETFGGEIYLTDGSHGCVNTPTEAMKAIYDHIQVGTPVIVHR